MMCDARGAFVDPPNIDRYLSIVLNRWGRMNAAIASVVASTIISDESKRRWSNHDKYVGRSDRRAPEPAKIAERMLTSVRSEAQYSQTGIWTT